MLYIAANLKIYLNMISKDLFLNSKKSEELLDITVTLNRFHMVDCTNDGNAFSLYVASRSFIDWYNENGYTDYPHSDYFDTFITEYGTAEYQFELNVNSSYTVSLDSINKNSYILFMTIYIDSVDNLSVTNFNIYDYNESNVVACDFLEITNFSKDETKISIDYYHFNPYSCQ